MEGKGGVSLKRFAAKSIIRRERTTAAEKEKEKEKEKRRLCGGAVGVGFPSPSCRNGLAIMGKLKPGIQPSTSLLVCKRACCLRWRVESPVCHIHDVFPRDTQHTAPWQHDIYRPPTSFHPLLLFAQPLSPSAPLCSTSRVPLSS